MEGAPLLLVLLPLHYVVSLINIFIIDVFINAIQAGALSSAVVWTRRKLLCCCSTFTLRLCREKWHRGLLLCTLYIFNVLMKKGYDALVKKACYNNCNNSNCAAAMTGSFIAVINTCFFINRAHNMIVLCLSMTDLQLQNYRVLTHQCKMLVPLWHSSIHHTQPVNL